MTHIYLSCTLRISPLVQSSTSHPDQSTQILADDSSYLLSLQTFCNNHVLFRFPALHCPFFSCNTSWLLQFFHLSQINPKHRTDKHLHIGGVLPSKNHQTLTKVRALMNWLEQQEQETVRAAWLGGQSNRFDPRLPN